MADKSTQPYILGTTLGQHLAHFVNEYGNATRAFNYGGAQLVDLDGEDASLPKTGGTARVRDVGRNAFLEDTGQRDGVSIIIPTLGQPEVLARCIESISRQTLVKRHPTSVQIIIVEDGVPSGAVTVFEHKVVGHLLNELRGSGTRVVRIQLDENRGRSIARNIGIDAADEPILVFVDNSMVLDRHFLVEHMMRHAKVRDAIALLGFKQNIRLEEYLSRQEEIRQGAYRPSFKEDLKYAHKLNVDEAPFEFGGKNYDVGDIINYMSITNYLSGLSADTPIGKRTLPTFFQTNIVSVRRDDVLRAGGFEPTFKLWGLEDSLLGARLIGLANCRLVPCPSAVAFNIEEGAPAGPTKLEDIAHNRALYESNLDKPITTDFEGLLENSLDGIRPHAIYLDTYPPARLRELRTTTDTQSRSTAPTPVGSAFDLDRAKQVTRDLEEAWTGTTISIKRHQLRDFIASERSQASHSATSLGGDLSWVREELPALQAVRASNPTVRLRIFYDRTGIARSMLPILQQLRNLDIELRPYPAGTTLNFRSMLIDETDANERRVVWYTRGKTPSPQTPNDEHPFFWHKAGADAAFIVDAISALVATFDALPRQPFRVGVCGVNNVGKTALVIGLQRFLETRRLQVNVIRDVFRDMGTGIDLERNYAMLMAQLKAEASGASCDVLIFDRTAIDNYAFLQMRQGHGAQQESALHTQVVSTARGLDMLLDVHPKSRTYTTPTRHVTAEQRSSIRVILDRFLKSHQLPTEPVVLDPEAFNASLALEVERIGLLIETRAITKQLLP